MEVCSSCGAFWATRGAMEAVIAGIERRFTAAVLVDLRAECVERRRAALAASGIPSISYRKCPECGVQMYRKAFAPLSGIVADVCAVHGFLLGAGQLEAIGQYVARGGELLALEAANQQLVDHLADLKRKVTDVEQAKAQVAGGVDPFFIV